MDYQIGFVHIIKNYPKDVDLAFGKKSFGRFFCYLDGCMD